VARNSIEPLPAEALGSATISFAEQKRERRPSTGSGRPEPAERRGGRFAVVRLLEGTDISVVAGSRGTWTITYVVGQAPLARGARIKVYRHPQKFWLGMVKQSTNPKGEDYTTVSTTGKSKVVLEELAAYYKDLHTCIIRVEEGDLDPGDKVFFRVGDTSAGGPPAAVPTFLQGPCRFDILVDADGIGAFVPLPESLVARVVADRPARAVVVAPSVARVGERGRVQLRLEDASANVVTGRAWKARLSSQGARVAVPSAATFGARGPAIREVTARYREAGVLRVGMKAGPQGQVAGVGNPTVVTEGEPPYRIFWADMHNHTDWVDGTGTSEESYLFGRDVAHLDICGLAEHVTNVPPHTRGQVFWPEMQALARKYNEPGRYVTFLGYEYSPGPRHPAHGDQCVFFLDDERPLVVAPTMEEVARRLGGDPALVIPHVGGRIADFDTDDPTTQRLVEVASMHGHFEWLGQEALQAGCRMGFVGMSDGHMGRPGYDLWARHGRLMLEPGQKYSIPKRPYSVPSALTAVLSSELTREAVWQALWDRRVYATSAPRVILSFTLNGKLMGSTLRTKSLPALEVCVHGTRAVDYVALIRGDRLLAVERFGTPDLQWEFVDEAPVVAREVPYYVRVAQADGEFAWSSPIWVTYTGKRSPKACDLRPWNQDIPLQPGSYEHYGPAGYLGTLQAILKRRVIGSRFYALKEVGVVAGYRGRYVEFWARDRALGGRPAEPGRAAAAGLPVHIHFYPDFAEEDRLYISPGWSDFGQWESARSARALPP